MTGGQHRQRPVDVLGRHDGDHADAHVERLLHLGALDPAALGDHARTPARASMCRGPPRRPARAGCTRSRLLASPPPVMCAERADLGLGGQRQAVLGVDAGRLEQLLAQRAAELLDMPVQRASGRCPAAPCRASEYPLECRPDEPIADHHVAGPDPVRARARRRPRRRRRRWRRGRSRSGAIRPGCSAVSPPSSAQPARTQPSAMPDDDRVDPLRHELADGDVVLQEQRLGAADHQVVDHHRDQVDADGVVLVHRLRDRRLGADAVGGRRPAAARGSRRAARTVRRNRRARRITSGLVAFVA